MRVSTQQIFQAGLSGMLQQQSTLNQLSQQLSTGVNQRAKVNRCR